jgi:hypothetical protein
MEAALSRSLIRNRGAPEDRSIPYTIVRSIQFLEFSKAIPAPAGAARLGKTGFDELMTEGRNARH